MCLSPVCGKQWFKILGIHLQVPGLQSKAYSRCLVSPVSPLLTTSSKVLCINHHQKVRVSHKRGSKHLKLHIAHLDRLNIHTFPCGLTIPFNHARVKECSLFRFMPLSALRGLGGHNRKARSFSNHLVQAEGSPGDVQ